MKYQETDHNGSFTALGVGFLYEYHARLKALHISRARGLQPLLQLDLDEPHTFGAFKLVLLLEKTTQVEALKFSNNATADISETLDDSRLPAILNRSHKISLYAFDIEQENFDIFQKNFLIDHELQEIEIRKIPCHATGRPFYHAHVETKRGNRVSARSSTLHGVTSYLSDKIMQDIVAKEFAYHVDSWVHKLLNTASVLSTVSFVLNHRFEPLRKVSHLNGPYHAKFSQTRKNSFHS